MINAFILAKFVWSSRFLAIKLEYQFKNFIFGAESSIGTVLRVCANLLKQWGICVIEIVVELISWLVEITRSNESPQESICV